MDVDTITVTLVNSSTPADVESQKVILKSDGSSTYFTGSAIGTSCYIRVNHRNSLETWSAGPVNMAANTTYNFSSNQNQAYGDNLVQVAGVWAMYSGDVNQDGFIGGDDVGAVDNDNLAGLFFTYTTSDINGDLFVGGDDVGVVDNNNLAGVYLPAPDEKVNSTRISKACQRYFWHFLFGVMELGSGWELESSFRRFVQ